MFAFKVSRGANISEHLSEVPAEFNANSITDAGISDVSITIFLWIASTLCQAVDIFGIGTNIINIICFVKQGFKDPINANLLGLAVSDLCSLATGFWTSLCYNPAFMTADLPLHAIEFQYLSGAIPHTAFTRITAWMTALITLERCLCITAPLKVKQIVTTKRVTTVIVCIFATLMFSVAPLYVVNRLGPKFFPERNKTLIGLLYTDDKEKVERVSFLVNNTIVSFIAFVIIIVFTITLAIQLRQRNKWRIKSATSVQADIVSSRNQKVSKMVVMISVLFIVCFVPISFLFMAMSMVPGLSINGKYRNTLTIIGSVGFILESINSSSNIFIYYSMSSKYKVIFDNLF